MLNLPTNRDRLIFEDVDIGGDLEKIPKIERNFANILHGGIFVYIPVLKGTQSS